MNRQYSKLITLIAFIGAAIVLIVGVVKSINGMIIGGVISIFASALLGMGLMVHSSTVIKKPESKTINVDNPISEV